MILSDKNLCVICGINEASTVDHVPPKGIFPRPRPANLITVPACSGCNNNASTLDEAFRLYLALHVGDLEDQITENYFNEALRTYVHNQRLQREVLTNAEEIKCVNKNGEYIGQGLKVKWDSEAHDEIIERTVRGLYYHHYGDILGNEVVVSPKWFNRPDKNFVSMLKGLPVNHIGERQVSYTYGRAEESPLNSIWFFEFYERHWAGATTGPVKQK